MFLPLTLYKVIIIIDFSTLILKHGYWEVPIFLGHILNCFHVFLFLFYFLTCIKCSLQQKKYEKIWYWKDLFLWIFCQSVHWQIVKILFFQQKRRKKVVNIYCKSKNILTKNSMLSAAFILYIHLETTLKIHMRFSNYSI